MLPRRHRTQRNAMSKLIRRLLTQGAIGQQQIKLTACPRNYFCHNSSSSRSDSREVLDTASRGSFTIPNSGSDYSELAGSGRTLTTVA